MISRHAVPWQLKTYAFQQVNFSINLLLSKSPDNRVFQVLHTLLEKSYKFFQLGLQWQQAAVVYEAIKSDTISTDHYGTG